MSQNSLLTREQIEAIIPHRGKWLLLDEVLEIRDNKIVATKTFTKEECEGHFGIVPGHLICESLAQAGAILILHQHPEFKNGRILLTRTSGSFSSTVTPGEKVFLEVELVRLILTMRVAFLKGESSVSFFPENLLLAEKTRKPVSKWEGTGKIRD